MKTILSCFWIFLLLSTLVAGEATIVCTTDLHGRISMLPALGGAIRRAGREALRIDCGDTVQGTFESRFQRGRTVIAGLNALDYDFWVLGNHDFEFGFDAVRDLTARFRGQVLAADWRWGELAFPGWALAERGNWRIAVIGLTDPKMAQRVLPGAGGEFIRPYVALSRIMPEVRRANPDWIVLAWHNGLYFSGGNQKQFLKDFPEIDLVLGGHSHETHPGERVGRAYYVQPPCHGEGAILVRAEFDDVSRKLLRISSEVLRPDFSAPDPAVTAAVGTELREAVTAAEQVIARVSVPLALPNRGSVAYELGRVGANALRRAAGADVGYFAAAPLGGEGVKTVTAGALFGLLPYENRVCTIELTAAELAAFAAESFEQWKRRKWAVPAWAGIPVKPSAPGIDTGKLPARLTLALTDFSLAGSRVLRPLLDVPGRNWRILPFTERQAVERLLAAEPEF